MEYLKNLIAPSRIKDLLIETESDVNPQDIQSEANSLACFKDLMFFAAAAEVGKLDIAMDNNFYLVLS